MKLLYTPNSDGTAAFVASYISSQSYSCEAMAVYGPKSKTADCIELEKICKNGKLPCLVIDENTVLTEEPAILDFIGDQSRGVIAPLSGSKERYKVDQFIIQISKTLCIAIDELCVPGTDLIIVEHYRANLTASLAALSQEIGLGGEPYAAGMHFSIADIFLFAVLTKLNTSAVQVQTDTFPNLQAYYERIAGRADVKAAILRMNSSPTETFPRADPRGCCWCICGKP